MLLSLSALEFAYYHSPRNMKGFCMGLVYSVEGLGGLLSYTIAKVTSSINSQYQYHQNVEGNGEMQVFFIILVVCMVLGLGVFTATAHWFEEQAPPTATNHEPELTETRTIASHRV